MHSIRFIFLFLLIYSQSDLFYNRITNESYWNTPQSDLYQGDGMLVCDSNADLELVDENTLEPMSILSEYRFVGLNCTLLSNKISKIGVNNRERFSCCDSSPPVV